MGLYVCWLAQWVKAPMSKPENLSLTRGTYTQGWKRKLTIVHIHYVCVCLHTHTHTLE